MVEEQPINKRRFQAFLSHAHADKSIVDQLDYWLNNVCGIPIWYDDRDLPLGSQIATELPNAISKCRSLIIVLSKASLKSGWVDEEYQAAIDQRTRTKGRFRIIALRIEECEIPGFIRTTKWIDLCNGNLDLNIAKQILSGIYYIDNNVNPELTRDLFISRSWHPIERSLSDYICQLLINADFRLIGDAEDQKSFDENRIRSIMESCGGYVAVLPHKGEGKTSKYIIREIIIAKKIGLPSLIIADTNVELSKLDLPKDIIESIIPFSEGEIENPGTKFPNSIINDFVDEWREPIKMHYIFFATGLLKNSQRNEIIRDHIQNITAMQCIIGDKLRERNIQYAITKKICNAHVMIADISEDQLNTLIEAGIALGAGIRLNLVAQGPRRTPHFMFRDKQVEFYNNDVELLGQIQNIIYPYRRRILNYELRKDQNVIF
jgi:hypothetical protein